ncbi:hypothetical protein BJX63DRAFT_433489 [Aspergillus granulosus]|uniref:Uncharacterized protein n=1 Tax=Aspergillus granulosus TaxID=176169 RepID=A0ABR4H7F7_9EURO
MTEQHIPWPSTSNAGHKQLLMMNATDVEAPADLLRRDQMPPSVSTHSMPAAGGEPGRPPGSIIQTDRTMGRHYGASVEDYSRIMLEYTQRRMASVADSGSRSSRASNDSGQSGSSTSGGLASQASGQAPPKIRQTSDDDSYTLAARPAI